MDGDRLGEDAGKKFASGMFFVGTYLSRDRRCVSVDCQKTRFGTDLDGVGMEFCGNFAYRFRRRAVWADEELPNVERALRTKGIRRIVDDDAPRYNLSGQRVGPDYKGVVIINGKKKLMK